MAGPVYIAGRLVKDALLRLPPLRALNRGRAARRTGPTTEPDYVRGILSGHLERLRRHGARLRGAHMLELGPGHTLAQAVVCRALGAGTVTALDVEPHVADRHPVYRAVLEALPGWIAAGDFVDERGGERPELLHDDGSVRLDDDLRYRMTDGARLPLDDASVDLAYSTSVLEHVADCGALYRELARVLRPGALSSHVVDLKDHIHPDPLDMLRYGDRLWHWMQGHSPGYVNRLRLADHLGRIEAAGFEVVERGDRTLDRAPDPAELAPRFRAYPPEELRILEVILVLRRR